MQSPPDQIPAEKVEELAERGAPVVFEEEGLRLLPQRRNGFIRYADVTHLAVSPRAVAIGSVRDTAVLRRREFATEVAMQALLEALRGRIARLPDGGLRLAQMAELDELARTSNARLAVYGFIAACLVVFAAQWRDPFLTQVGSFIPELVSDGEPWRIVTANFLHDTMLFPVHLALNMLCIAVIGLPVERALGSWRTGVVMAFAAVGSMYGSTLAGYPSTIGASGVAAGLAGSLLCIELNGSRRIPVWWRIPRRVFIGALLAQLVFDYFAPFIAGAAHIGGFVAGYVITRMFVEYALLRRPAGRGVRVIALMSLAMVVASSIAIRPLLRRDAVALEDHGLRVLRNLHGDAQGDNAVAWVMVTESEPSAIGVQVAAELAERAVAETGRSDPFLLDTLAEVLFVAGDVPGALIVIDEAIELTGGDRYYLEQRRRFAGERAREDRPDPPIGDPWLGTPLESPLERPDREPAPFDEEMVI